MKPRSAGQLYVGAEMRIHALVLCALLGIAPSLGLATQPTFFPNGRWYSSGEGGITINGVGPFGFGTALYVATSGNTICVIKSSYALGSLAISELYVGTTSHGHATLRPLRVLEVAPTAQASGNVIPLELFMGETRIIRRYTPIWETRPRYDLFEQTSHLDSKDVATCQKELAQ